MDTVVTNILTNLSSGQIWSTILTIIPLFCSLAGISLGVLLIWSLLNWRFNTVFYKRWSKRAVRRLK